MSQFMRFDLNPGNPAGRVIINADFDESFGVRVHHIQPGTLHYRTVAVTNNRFEIELLEPVGNLAVVFLLRFANTSNNNHSIIAPPGSSDALAKVIDQIKTFIDTQVV